MLQIYIAKTESRQMIHMKCQTLFSLKKKNQSDVVVIKGF